MIVGVMMTNLLAGSGFFFSILLCFPWIFLIGLGALPILAAGDTGSDDKRLLLAGEGCEVSEVMISDPV